MFQNIHPSWKDFLISQTTQPYFIELVSKVSLAYKNNQCYPQPQDILRLLKIVSFNDIKVVILGQDPYHQPNQANGLSFSVNHGVKLPPSLKNIFVELENDLGIILQNGDLTKWVRSGVFLLNTVLTVQKDQPFSHANFNWQEFTDNLIKYIDNYHNNVIFVLWGKKAQAKINLINDQKHLILMGVHPSPLGAHYGFFNQKYFSKINEYLIKHNKKPIDWQL
ncbi:uracil-DNA glycosylase [Spiroplasma endosymbiont of 'Nebria riversi']|uniref:uracil-DNA glycosylase n=1 Tax=Spiroplasma endosymbiont of 'Nebria riversi' TaxID=2792084 RepID=UPI001C046C9C|nr:uracil-DNA glycosylase [Spiroplasma endosymbiont of 'Nebria riversi']